MAFVNEREKFRVIDYERNVYITGAQKPAIRNPDVHAWDLHWNNEVIWFAAFFSADYEKNGNNLDGVSVHYSRSSANS